MNRIPALWRSSPRTLLLGLGTIGLAAAVTVGSGADFTSTSANPSNIFTAGTMTHFNSKAGAAILTASLMRPGDTASGTVDIQNTGSLSGNFSLAKTVSAETAGFASKLTIVITDTGDPSCVVRLPRPGRRLLRHHRGHGQPGTGRLRGRRNPPLQLRGDLPEHRRPRCRCRQRLPGRYRDGALHLDRYLLTETCSVHHVVRGRPG